MFSVILDARCPSLTPAVTSGKKKSLVIPVQQMHLLDLQNYCKILIHRQILLELTYLSPGDYLLSIINGEQEASLVIHLI